MDGSNNVRLFLRGSNPRPPEEMGGQGGSEKQEGGQYMKPEKRCDDKDGGKE